MSTAEQRLFVLRGLVVGLHERRRGPVEVIAKALCLSVERVRELLDEGQQAGRAA